MLESLDGRTGDFEIKEHYALSVALDPRLVDCHINLNQLFTFQVFPQLLHERREPCGCQAAAH